MRQPPISLVNLSDEEKEKYSEVAQKNLVRGITMFLVPFVIFGFLVAYVNMYYEKLGLYQHDDLREWINVGLVFLTILPARLFVNVILRYRKSINEWQKKIIRGKIVTRDGNIFTVANQKIKLSKEEAAKWKVNDNVIISISTTGDFVFGVEVGTEE